MAGRPSLRDRRAVARINQRLNRVANGLCSGMSRQSARVSQKCASTMALATVSMYVREDENMFVLLCGGDT